MSNWRPTYGEYLRGKQRVTIVQDKEANGAESAQKVRASVPHGIEVERLMTDNGSEALLLVKDSKPDIIILNSLLSSDEAVRALRFEKGMENVKKIKTFVIRC